MDINIKLRDSVNVSHSIDAIRRWYLIPNVRILIVVDGPIGVDSADFGLGMVIDTLESESFYSNVRFRITCATRAGAPQTNPSATSTQFKYRGFRFDMAGFNINNYDQIWFFGFDPGNDASPNDANIDTINPFSNPNPLNDPAEIDILNNWMNANRGGVLAMGDHHYLGASLCSKIPRVRKMRRWTNADNVPSISGPDRHDTNQDKTGTGVIGFDAQSDDTPQPIEVLKKRYSKYIFTTTAIPHPILCGADGVINIFPDHPHEGEVLGTLYDTGTGGTPVDLTAAYPGAAPEFPDYISGTGKPEPQIIALGHPLNSPRHEKNQPFNTNNPTHTNSSAPFGLVNVYNGEQAGVGRIVTDATWHHWFNINLVGLDTVASADRYRKIQNYFTNVAVWLCNEGLRNSILTTWVWGYLIREFDPMRFSAHDSIWRLGINARDALGRTASQCNTYEWISIYIPDLIPAFEIPHKFPCFSCPPIDIFEIGMLGGIMKQLIPLVEKYRIPEKFNRQHIDVQEINKAISKGLADGYEELLSTFEKSLESTTQLFRLAKKGLKKESLDLQVEMNTVALRIEIESILFNSPVFFSMLNDDKEHFIAVSISNAFGSLNAEPIKIYLKERNDALANAWYYKTNFTIIENAFQDGEILIIELYLDDELYNERNKIYDTVLSGEVRNWIGAYTANVRDLIQKNTPVAVKINISEAGKQ
uniref:Uncharacterized protein n=1 Tax=uncultured bacterium BLR12 TaxID=506514 RepID=C0ING7_9BACT|nr:hypothetical protein AKSOIL_0238 [uncultured bacterium BLR12]